MPVVSVECEEAAGHALRSLCHRELARRQAGPGAGPLSDDPAPASPCRPWIALLLQQECTVLTLCEVRTR